MVPEGALATADVVCVVGLAVEVWVVTTAEVEVVVVVVDAVEVGLPQLVRTMAVNITAARITGNSFFIVPPLYICIDKEHQFFPALAMRCS